MIVLLLFRFVSSKRSDAQPFLRELLKTQMFDDFVTKRLFGSCTADIAIFDHAIDKYLKSTSLLNTFVARGGMLSRNKQ